MNVCFDRLDEQDVFCAQHARAAVGRARHLPVKHTQPSRYIKHAAIDPYADDRDFYILSCFSLFDCDLHASSLRAALMLADEDS